MDILKRNLFILLLFGLIGGEVLRLDNGQSIAITFLDSIVGIFVLASFFIAMLQQKKLHFSRQEYLLWFIVFGVISLLLHMGNFSLYQFLVALLYAIRFLFYTIGILISVTLLDTKFKKIIPYFLFGTSIVLSLFGLLQYFYYPALRNLYYAGWDEHLYRLFSTFLDPNFIGLFFVCGLLLGIHLFVQEKTLPRKIFLSSGITLTMLTLFLTYSRGAYIAALVGVSVTLWRMGYRKLIFAVTGLIVVGVIGLELLSPRSEGTKLLRTASVDARLDSVRQAGIIIVHDPFMGVGFDAYRYAQQKEGFLTKNIVTTHSGAGTDNSFLFVFATTGIAGLLAYFMMTYNVLKLSFVSKTPIGHALFATYLALIVGSFFVNALFYPFLLVWAWVLLGLI